jgi:hypothetical protein
VTVGTVLDAPATRAFFHGNFVDTFSDGDVTTAASNGRFYADMSETTTAFGTVSVTSTTSTSTTYQLVVPTELTGTNVLVVGGGGGGGTGSGWPTGGGGGEVQNLTNQTISAGTYTIVVGNGGGTNASGTNSSALGTTANPGTSASNNGGTSGSGNGPGSNYGQYERGGGGGDASVGGNAGDRTGGSGGDGSNVSWLDGSVYGEQVSGQAYFGGGGYSGDYTGSQTNGKGNGLPGTGGGGTLGGIGRGGMIAIYSSVGLGIKYIGFDTYNKLSLSGITNPTSKLHVLPTGAESTTTYDIGTATNIYIESEGTYTAEMKGSDAFALDSNVVTGLNDPVYITPKLDGGAIYIQGALDNAGGLYLCGLGSDGQLGQGDTNNSTNYVKVKGVGGSGFLENIIDFKCGSGDAFVVACDSSGNCYAWGKNTDGYLGQGNVTDSYTPLQVKGVGGTGFLENIINVSAGHKTAYACDSSGNAYAWGDNFYNSSATQGMLGDGTIVDKTTPIRVVGVGGTGYLSDIIQVSANGVGRSGYALSSSGSVYAWGGNDLGQLGNATNTGSLTPVQVVGVGGTGYLSGIIKLAEATYSYNSQIIALGSDGRVYAWGGGGGGELGQ